MPLFLHLYPFPRGEGGPAEPGRKRNGDILCVRSSPIFYSQVDGFANTTKPPGHIQI